MIFRIEQPRENLSCSACGSEEVFARGAVTRRFRSVPIGSKAVWIEFAVPRVRCCRCGLERQVLVPFAEPKKTYTKSFARYVLELSSHMTIQGVAQHLNVGWDLVKQIQKQNLQRHFSQPKLRDLKRIAIDEIYVGKRHKYLTLVLDLDRGAIVYVGQGKGEAALTKFWQRLRSSHAKVQAVAADLSPAYSSAIRKNLPQATLVFDRFHLVKLLNERLRELREKTELKKGMSVQTSNHYLRAIKQFTRWLCRRKRLRHDPLIELEMLNVAVDRRHDRRALSDDEVSRILDAA